MRSWALKFRLNVVYIDGNGSVKSIDNNNAQKLFGVSSLFKRVEITNDSITRKIESFLKETNNWLSFSRQDFQFSFQKAAEIWNMNTDITDEQALYNSGELIVSV